MDEHNKNRLIEAWIQMHLSESDSEEYESNFWAHEELWELCRNSPDEALELIINIIDDSPNEWILGNVAAGPFEDLMCYHGEVIMPKLKALSTNHPKLIQAMAGVWLDSNDTKVWQEFYSMAGVEPPFPESSA